ncbi:uncharacterized protein AMSG_05661 [Thecamonas trahens ATCC 50062]|uniref:Uncharacterized protein n=1 Tax=Thecamonas trahens ATCC 50062 TaxID=461836 RepID=A0A0L0DE76_THETB|nr:hypothetical protein AMSG_05661 [Thecamonas trahens ATCC 50062]KNC49618.1 hypothetical protein AMSG_05661 [Thecamonas trahens ATCC 50062]|eukprot:XP_013757723.1 hypothetical protein AMSG_05661 [Thecamonas trahens ATCC 50062]
MATNTDTGATNAMESLRHGLVVIKANSGVAWEVGVGAWVTSESFPVWHSTVIEGCPPSAAQVDLLQMQGKAIDVWAKEAAGDGALAVINGMQSNYYHGYQFAVVDGIALRPPSYADKPQFSLAPQDLVAGDMDPFFWVFETCSTPGLVRVEVDADAGGVVSEVSSGRVIESGLTVMPLVVDSADASDGIHHVDPRAERVGPNSVMWQKPRSAAFSVIGVDSSGRVVTFCVLEPVTVAELVVRLLDAGMESAL